MDHGNRMACRWNNSSPMYTGVSCHVERVFPSMNFASAGYPIHLFFFENFIYTQSLDDFYLIGPFTSISVGHTGCFTAVVHRGTNE